VPVWDAIVEAGKKFGIKPAGMLALDAARLEAGFILLEVDYTSVEKAFIPSQRYTLSDWRSICPPTKNCSIALAWRRICR
jgi:hypothetical protein